MTKLVFIPALFIVVFTYAQNPIPNPGFENWSEVGFPAYDDPDDWGTVNSGTSLIGIFTVTQASGADAHSGNYAVKLETHYIPFPIDRTAPGIIASGFINQNTQEVEGGVAVTYRPESLKGWYKYSPATGDNCSISIDVFKWNSNTSQREVIGSGSLEVDTTVSSYTEFEVPITYTSQDVPDTIVITILSSDSQNPVDGSVLYVDDLELPEEMSVAAPLRDKVSTEIWPNPFQDILMINGAKNKNVIRVFNASGQLVFQKQLIEQDASVDLGDLAKGIYLIQMLNSDKKVTQEDKVLKL